MSDVETRTLEVPGATLTYDVRPAAAGGDEPPLVLIGSPMGAGGFATLAGHFPDRTVVTYDPRGSERSVAHDPGAAITPEVQADDVHRIIDAVGGPVDLFASSGGAVVAFALVAATPGAVRTLVAHEPPLAALVPDREHALAVCRAVHDTYQRSGRNAAMAHFIAIVSHRGPFTAELAAAPAPDPAAFGMPSDDDGSRDDLMFAHSMRWLTSYEPDLEALRRAPTRIVVAVGAASDGELAHRGGEAIAARLGTAPAVFPGDHGGFLGNEYGQPGEPDAFAATLREVLAG
jgi:pimeloyl-ACP methyl ester carboxylesterase